MKPFSRKRLSDVFDEIKRSVSDKVERLTNDEIMSNDIDILADWICDDYYINPVFIYEEDTSKRTIKQTKVKRYHDLFMRSLYHKEYVMVDGVIGTFVYPFSGDSLLFDCSASTYSISGYPDIKIGDDSFSISITKTLEEMNGADSKDKLLHEIDKNLDCIKTGIGYANNDVLKFNKELKPYVIGLLQKKKEKTESFFEIARMFEVPIVKTEYAKKHIPIQKKDVHISHISHSYDREDYYGINDVVYQEILAIIKHICSTFERTPSSYKELKEEALRNIILSLQKIILIQKQAK